MTAVRTDCNCGLSSAGSMTCGPGKCLAFGELEALAGARLSRLLALFLAGIATKQTGLLQRRPQGGINLNKSAGHCEAQGAGLADESAAVGLDLDIKFLEGVDGLQGLQ